MKNILNINNIYKFFIFLLCFFFISNVYWEECKYKSEIDMCDEANEKWTTKSIEDFVCIVWSHEEVSYQVVLDMEFKVLDEKMDLFVENLEKNKNKYFWINRQATYYDWINDMHLKKEYFYTEYKKLCWIWIAKEVIACNSNEKTTINRSHPYFIETSCMKLVEKKLEIFDDLTFSILMLNKQQIKKDEKKLYDQWQRRNYNILLWLMRINLWYLERIWKKWPSKILNTY